MHTLTVIAGGLAGLVICLLLGRMLKAPAASGLAFIPLWLVAAALNMWIGVTHAGYSWAAEFPIFLVVFGVPAAAALLAWRRFR